MQLGTRWQVNTAAPQNLVPAVSQAVRDVEMELSRLNQDTSTWYWTLTYLENRPVVQLDDGTTLRINAEGTVSIHQEE